MNTKSLFVSLITMRRNKTKLTKNKIYLGVLEGHSEVINAVQELAIFYYIT